VGAGLAGDELPTRIILAVGEERVLALPGLATAGYQWSASVSGSDPGVVEVQLRRGNLPARTRPGQSVPEQAVFRGVRSGAAVVRLQQRRSWELDRPAAEEVELHVTVL
jgi:predicted secreted protein